MKNFKSKFIFRVSKFSLRNNYSELFEKLALNSETIEKSKNFLENMEKEKESQSKNIIEEILNELIELKRLIKENNKKVNEFEKGLKITN